MRERRTAAPKAIAPQREARRYQAPHGRSEGAHTAARSAEVPSDAGAAPPLADVLLAAARTWSAFASGTSLDRALARSVADDASRLRAATQDVAYSAVRRRALSEWLIAELAERPPTPPVAALLAVALPQLIGEPARFAPRPAGPGDSSPAHTRHGAHTVVDQAVVAARAQAATANAAGFVNALLRNFLRQRDALLDRAQRDDTVRYNAPDWWIAALRDAQPEHWRTILQSATEPPPLVLRVNTRHIAVEAMLDKLAAHELPAVRVGMQAVALERAVPVARIPGFSGGDVSVQDAGAQLAVPWLTATAGMRVLDACAAPGGKTAHLIESADLDLTALEQDGQRAQQILDNLQRIGRPDAVRVQVADARDVQAWWDGRPFDRILLDAPCTASGIVRRHPDIPWLRRKADVAQLTTLQAELLEALWPLLGVGGRLLYVVCSVFPQEGSEQAGCFAARHPDAAALALPGGAPAVQLLPTVGMGAPWIEGGPPTVHDGFCYALFEKSG